MEIENIYKITDALDALADWIYGVNDANGWHEDEPLFPEQIALITSEASEALEALRESGDVLARWYTYTLENVGVDGVKVKNLTRKQVESIMDQSPEDLGLIPKPEGVGPELADILIRVIHTAKRQKINLSAEVVEKIQHNTTRGYKHGGKHF